MKNKTTSVFLKVLVSLLALLFLLPSCAVKNNHYYVPPEGNVLTLTECNDLKISGTTSINDEGITNVQIGYSPIKHIGVFGSWMHQKNGKGIYPFEVSNYENANSANYKSAAIGGFFFKKRDTYYRTLLPKKHLEQGGFLVDLYFGIGEGRFKRDYETFRTYVEFDHKKIFGQAGFHYKFRSLGVSYIYKIGQIEISNVLVHGNFILFPKSLFDELKNDNTINTYESTFRFEYGIREAKLNLNLTTFSDHLDFFTPLRSYYSVGILINIDEFFRKKKEQE